MSQENVEIVRQVYAAAARRDTASVLAFYDPEVEWDFTRAPLGGLMGGRLYRGHKGLRRFYREWREAWEYIAEECEELIDAGEQVITVARWRGRGRASGIEIEDRGQTLVWTIREGKIVRVELFPTHKEAVEAAGLRE